MNSPVHTTIHTSNTFNETILETKLHFYILRMFMHDSIHALKVDETVQSARLLLEQFTGGSSL